MPKLPENVTVTKLLKASCVFWADKSKIILPSGPFDFAGREYLIEPVNEWEKMSVDIKATQGGFTVTHVLKVLWAMIKGWYPQGVLYLFPTGNDVSDFSKSRFDPIIADNWRYIGRFVQNTNAVHIKKVGKAFLYLRGARLSQSVEGEKESAGLRSISVDKVVYDEWDLFDPTSRQKAVGRMGASEIKHESFLSNPTIPDFGIDRLFKETDQRYWMIKCEKCREYTCLELEFPECIRIDKQGKGVRVCVKCGSPIDRRKGQWVAKYPNIKDKVGRQWSQLNSPTIDPGDVLRAFENPPDGNIGDVHRLMLGRAYIEAENRLTRQDIYSCCSHEGLTGKDDGPCAMGVDVGRILHIVIAKRLANGIIKIVYLGRHSDHGDLFELKRKYNVKVGAIDLYPETRMVRSIQAHIGIPFFGIEYKDKQTRGVIEDQEINVLKTSRTESMDAVHNVFIKKIIMLPRRSKEVDEYAHEMTCTAKCLVENERGDRLYRYRAVDDGQDHYYHATNCMNLVMDRVPNAHIGPKPKAHRDRQYNPLWSGLRRKRA